MTLRTTAPLTLLLALVSLALLALGIDAGASGNGLPAGYKQFTGVTLWADSANAVVQVTAVPNHNSPYFFPGDPRYEPYGGPNPNFQQNPNHILTQTIEFRIPLSPAVNSNHPATPLGPIGVSINGVPFFNQYAGPGQPLTNEINSFDQYNGHPQMTGVYHYHVEPLFLTDEDKLLGYLLDGFPVYSSIENGDTITNADLDVYHGHSHATAEYPGGIYHYHLTAEAPYLNGAGFYGTPGTVSYSFSATPTPTPTSGATATPTSSPTPTASPTPKNPLGDSDGDTVANDSDPDDDNDGCTDVAEVGANPLAGGGRNPHVFWDFFDVPTPPSFTRDKAISVGDIAAIVARFGSSRPGGPPDEATALAEAHSAPPAPPAYHAGYDRTPSGALTGAPDGAISVQDIGRAVAQFGHSCA
jgi:hypothetical protein